MITSRSRRAFTLIELLVVIAIIAVLIGLLLPAIQQVRWAAARSQSTNNLHQLMLAAHSYHDVNGFLPFNGSEDATSADCTSGSWGYQILPYLEQGTLYDTQPSNSANVAVPVGPFRCSMRARPGYYTGIASVPVTGTITQLEVTYSWGGSPVTLSQISTEAQVQQLESLTILLSLVSSYSGITLTPISSSTIPFTAYPGSPYTFTPVSNPQIDLNVWFFYQVTVNNGPATISTTNGPWSLDTTPIATITSTTSAGLSAQAYIVNDDSIVITATGSPGTAAGNGPATDFGINPYLNSTAGTLSASNSQQTLSTILDGTSNTIFLGHMYCPVAEYPLTTASIPNARLPIFDGGTDGTSRNGLGDTSATWLQDGTPIALNQWGSPMSEGGLMAMADGSVHLVLYSMPLTNLLNPNDGVVVDLP